MAKKIKFESFVYRFLITAQHVPLMPLGQIKLSWAAFLNQLEFKHEDTDVSIYWNEPTKNLYSVSISGAKFYMRGDSQSSVIKQRDAGMLDSEDIVKIKNDKYFKEIVMKVAESAGYAETNNSDAHEARINNERDFHDAWANSEDVEKIDVMGSNEVCTAPEMRYITKRLGNIKGKKLLDVGCGLGEASVYFALLGATVTSSDLSQGMLDATTRLARANGVIIKQHIASAENMQLPDDEKFDIVYAGNLLHHVDIEETIVRIKPHLAIDGVLVTWDPLAYNPAINIYRKMASDVRTPDEHPLKWSDIKLFQKHFQMVETRYFWFTTLIIFIIMALAQRRNPNEERFWKVVVQEGNKWKWLYRPLELLDRLLLMMIPPLRLLCWNIVVISKI